MTDEARFQGLRITPGRAAELGTGAREQPSAHAGDSEFVRQLVERAQRLEQQLAQLREEQARIERAIARLEPLDAHYRAIIDAERAIAGDEIDPGEPPPQRAWPWQR